MKKSHKFDELSDKKCNVPGCRKMLKQRLVASKEPHKITKCYNHDLALKRAEQKEKNHKSF